jgi:hypothetical protein
MHEKEMKFHKVVSDRVVLIDRENFPMKVNQKVGFVFHHQRRNQEESRITGRVVTVLLETVFGVGQEGEQEDYLKEVHPRSPQEGLVVMELFEQVFQVEVNQKAQIGLCHRQDQFDTGLLM